MKTALQRSMSPDPDVRYQATLDLIREPGAAAEARLGELLADPTEVVVEEASFMREDPEYATIDTTACGGLRHRRAWRTLLAMAPKARASVARNCVYCVVQAGMGLTALSDAELDVLVTLAAEHRLTPQDQAVARFEREFIPRARAMPAEQAWHERMQGHPEPRQRSLAFFELTRSMGDPRAAAELAVEALRHPDKAMREVAAQALAALPAVLPAETVRTLCASPQVREVDGLLGALAKYGEPAAALVPLCLEALQFRKAGTFVMTIANAVDERRFRIAGTALVALGDAAASARPVLRERLLATNETLSLEGSLRRWLLFALGGADRVRDEVAAELEAMRGSGDPQTSNRARELRRLLGLEPSD